MMAPEKLGPKNTKKNETQSSGSRKSSSLKPPEQAINCPRCDSPNTKFCYYNNYSLTQPRHFCKTCRRYWTRGGALRNVPIGGGCRKNKKFKPSLKHAGEYDTSGRLNFLNGLPPTMDFQLSRLHSSINTSVSFAQFPSFSDISMLPISSNMLTKPKFNLDPVENFDFPIMGSLNINSNLASSIESLSSINQDLHLKLQQQRLGFMLNGENINGLDQNQQKEQPILFENLEIYKESNNNNNSGNGNLETEWYFDNNSYGGNVRANENWNNNGVHHHQDWSNVSNLNNCLP